MFILRGKESDPKSTKIRFSGENPAWELPISGGRKKAGFRFLTGADLIQSGPTEREEDGDVFYKYVIDVLGSGGF